MINSNKEIELRKKLKKELENILVEEKDEDIFYFQLIRILSDEESKEEVISKICDNEDDYVLLESIYGSVLNEIKKEYNSIIQVEMQEMRKLQSKKIKVPLPFKILATGKIIKKLFK